MRLTEDVIDFSIAEKKTDTAERYIRVDLDTISRLAFPKWDNSKAKR